MFDFPRLLPGLRYPKSPKLRVCVLCEIAITCTCLEPPPSLSLSLSLAVWRNKMRKGKKEKRKSGLYPRVNRRRNIRSTFSAASEERREEKRYFFSPFQKCICTMLPAHSPPPIWGYSHRFSHTPPTGFAKRDKGLPSKKRDSNVAAPAQGFLGDLPPEHRSYAVHISLM